MVKGEGQAGGNREMESRGAGEVIHDESAGGGTQGGKESDEGPMDGHGHGAPPGCGKLRGKPELA